MLYKDISEAFFMRHTAKDSKLSVKTSMIAIGITVLIFFTVLALMSALAYASKNPSSNIGIYSLSGLVASGFASGLALTKMKKGFGISYSALSTAAFVLLYTAAALILNGRVCGAHLLNAVCFAGASAFGMLLGKCNRKRKRRSR